MSEILIQSTLFFSGFTAATFAGAGLFFFRFWRTSRDRFFFIFALACWFLTLERVLSLHLGSSLDIYRTDATEQIAKLYLIRLSAFIAIGIAILDKNRSKDGQ